VKPELGKAIVAEFIIRCLSLSNKAVISQLLVLRPTTFGLEITSCRHSCLPGAQFSCKVCTWMSPP